MKKPANSSGPETGVSNKETPWHAMDAASALSELGVSGGGLRGQEAEKRLAEHGPNVLQHVAGDSPLTVLWRQVNNPLIWVLVGSSVLAVGLGKVTDGLVVAAVVVINSLIGFVQELRASRAIEALRDMVPQIATVRRDGHLASVSVADLVPGDIIMLASGDKVPADVRLLQVKNLRIEEAVLTGESVPVEKQPPAVDEDAALGDQFCMAFSGTLVAHGTATAVVVETGGRTQLGHISKMLQEATDLETPLTRALAWLGKVITIAILVLSGIILAFGVFRATQAGVGIGDALRETLVFAIALAVGAIPEGLPAVVTIALAIGVRRMAARRAIIRKLPAVETLGSTTVICSDKTGTLTRNEMTVTSVWTPELGTTQIEGVGYEPVGDFIAPDGSKSIPEAIRSVLRDAALCNDATLLREGTAWAITGDPTEGALVVAASKAGDDVDALRAHDERVDAIPFESENQFMATLHMSEGGARVVLKGAPEAVLRRCGQADLPIDDEQIRAQVDAFAKEGKRVLAVATKPWEDMSRRELNEEDVADGLHFGGLVGMIDPPRTEAIEAVRACHAAGVVVKMITGDHKGTAQAIGAQLGLPDTKQAMEGKQLTRLDDAALRATAVETSVFARVAPEHKMMLVKALQAEGNIVAMTGDGVNDAPALKQANIGVAMGISGTSVSKESADVVLTDDNFATIVAAVEEGRRVYDNLVKSLAFLLPTNLGLAFILMYAVLFLPFDSATKTLLLPVQPTQLLWINLVAAVALALPLAFEAKEPNVMQRPPRSPNEPILSKLVVRRTVLASILMTVAALGLFRWQYDQITAGTSGADSLAEAQTMAVTTVIFFQVFYMLNCRSLRDSVWRIGLFSNGWVYVGIGVTLALQMAFIYAPPLQAVFGTAPLDIKELGVSAIAGIVTLPVITIEKWISRRLARRGHGGASESESHAS